MYCDDACAPNRLTLCIIVQTHILVNEKSFNKLTTIGFANAQNYYEPNSKEYIARHSCSTMRFACHRYAKIGITQKVGMMGRLYLWNCRKEHSICFALNSDPSVNLVSINKNFLFLINFSKFEVLVQRYFT